MADLDRDRTSEDTDPALAEVETEEQNLQELKEGVTEVDFRLFNGGVVALEADEATFYGKAPGIRIAAKTMKDNGALGNTDKSKDKLLSPNEDGFLVIQHKDRTVLLFLDGVGSINGNKGNALAVEGISKAIHGDRTLEEAVQEAQEVVREYNRTQRKQVQGKKVSDADTVYVAIEIEGEDLQLIYAGDVEAMILDENSEILFETTPHTIPAQQVKKGLMSKKVYWKKAKKNTVLESLHKGCYEIEKRRLKPGMRIVVRSDGLSDNSSSYESARMIADDAHPSNALHRLVQHQLDMRGTEQHVVEDIDHKGNLVSFFVKTKGDNGTVAVIDFIGEEPSEVAETIEVSLVDDTLRSLRMRFKSLLTWLRGEGGDDKD